MNDKFYKNFMITAPFAFAYCKLILDKNDKPSDYKILFVNNAFEEIMNYKKEDIVNKRISSIIKDDKKKLINRINIYAEVALNCKTKEIEEYSPLLNKWFKIQIHSTEKFYFSLIYMDVTELKERERIQNEQSAFLNSLLTSIPDLIFAKDINGVYLGCNQAFSEYIGKPQVEIIGKTDYELVDKETADFFRKKDREMLENLKSKNNEEWVVYPDGKNILLDTLKTPFWGPNKELIGILGISRNITERKMMETSLKDIEAKNRFFLENIDDLVFVFDEKFDLLEYYIPNEYDIWEALKLEYGINFWQIGLPEPASKIIFDAINECFISNKPVEAEYFLDFSTPVRWFNMHVNILDSKLDNLKKVVCVVRNITTQKESDEKIKDYIKIQEILIEISKTFINVELSRVDEIINFSLEVMGEFIGADRVYIFNYDFVNQVTNNTYEWCASEITPEIDNLQNSPIDNISLWLDKHKLGKEFYVYDVSALPDEGENCLKRILEPQGIKSIITVPIIDGYELIGFVGFDFVRRLHQYTVNDKTLLFIFAQLLVSVKKRIEYATKLTLAVEEAELATKIKSEFLANMSHEIRTPLNSIIGFTNLLTNTPLNEIQKEYLQYANSSATVLLKIINEILDFSKIEANKVELDIIKTDVIDLINSIYNIFKYNALNKELEFLLEIDPNTPKYAFFDPFRLKQILTNLLDNGIKFTQKGYVKLKLVFNKIDENSGEFIFFVIDSGIGISEDQKDKLFRAFSQADTSTTRKFGGTGLGLIISNLLVQKMGSQIQLESRPEYGSTFYLSLKTRYLNDSNSTIQSSNDTNGNIPDNNTDFLSDKRVTILIAEDINLNMVLLKSIILNHFPNSEVIEAKNGIEALEYTLNKKVDIILMDIQMPELDGIEVTKEIRKLELKKDCHIPIIALTAGSIQSEYDKCIKAGMDDFLTKPIDKELLLLTLKKHLNLNGREDSLYERIIDKVGKTKSFNKDRLLQQVGNNLKIYDEVIKLSIDNITTYIEELKSAIHSNSSLDIKKKSHKIKGSSASVTLDRLSLIAKFIEEYFENDTETVQKLLSLLEDEWKELLTILKS